MAGLDPRPVGPQRPRPARRHRRGDRLAGDLGRHGPGGQGPPGSPWDSAQGSLGYLLDPTLHGQGFGTEIVAALLALAFDDLGLHRVTASCFADNVGSWRVMEKCGMRREQHGVQDSWHAELGWIDGYTYAILREEWQRPVGEGVVPNPR